MTVTTVRAIQKLFEWRAGSHFDPPTHNTMWHDGAALTPVICPDIRRAPKTHFRGHDM